MSDQSVKLGDIVYFYDEDRQPHSAIVAHVHKDRIKQGDRPVCNLAMFKRDGRVANRPNVEPAYNNGEKWVLLNKWSWPDEVPEDEWSYLPAPVMRKELFGATSSSHPL